MSGYFAVLYDEEGCGPEATGIGRYDSKEYAIKEAQDWARAENLPCDYPLVNENYQTNNMAKPVSISKILDPEEYADKQTVMCITGKLIAVYGVKKGDDYEYQNATIEDATGKIDVTFSKCSQPSSAKGKTITIESKQSAAHGWQGIKVEDKEWEKDGETKHKRGLRITASAAITYADGGGSSSGGKSTPQQTSGQASGSSSKGASIVGKYDIDLSLHPANIVQDALDLHTYIRTLVGTQYTDGDGKLLVNEEELRVITSSVYIQSCHRGADINFRERSEKPLPKKYPPTPADPAKWRECVLTSGTLEGKTLAEISDDDLKKLFDYYDKKQANHALAECVYRAAEERGLLKQKEEDKELDAVEEDDIPF